MRRLLCAMLILGLGWTSGMAWAQSEEHGEGDGRPAVGRKVERLKARRREHLENRLAELKEKNPQRYEELMNRRQEWRKRRLEEFKQNHPDRYERFVEKHPHWKERLRDRRDRRNNGVRDWGRGGVGQGGEGRSPRAPGGRRGGGRPRGGGDGGGR